MRGALSGAPRCSSGPSSAVVSSRGEMACHLPDRRGEAEDRGCVEGSRSEPRSGRRPWTRPGPQATAARRARRISSRSSSAISSPCVARGVRAKREGVAPCHASIARAVGARSAAWHDGRRRARGRRGQALVDAKARLGVRAFAALRRLRGRTNSVVRPGRMRPRRAERAPPRGGAARHTAGPRQAKPRLGLRATAVRRGPEAALGRRDATRRGFTGRDGEGRTGPPPARPVRSGSSTAPPPGAEGGALSCSSSASSPSSSWSCSRSSRSARSCRTHPRGARPERSTHGACGRRGTEAPTSAPARRARKGTGAPHGACPGPLLGPPSGTRRVAPRSPMGSIGLAPADMKRSALLRAGPARLRGIASASLTLAAASPAA